MNKKNVKEDVKSYLSNFTKKSVGGLYSFAHYEHKTKPNTWIQKRQNGDFMVVFHSPETSFVEFDSPEEFKDYIEDYEKKHVAESLSDMADRVDRDHEVELARSELYQIADHAIKLHDMFKGISEEEGLDANVQANITKAASYLDIVYHEMDYKMTQGEIDISSDLTIDDTDAEIDNALPIPDEETAQRPGRSLESRSYKKKSIKETKEYKQHQLREIEHFENQLSSIIEENIGRLQ